MTETSFDLTQLMRRVLESSDDKEWQVAKLEWEPADIEFDEDGIACICGHAPVKLVCPIRHKRTGETLDVGCICLEKFLGVDYRKVFSGVQRLWKKLDSGMPKALYAYAVQREMLDDWEMGFVKNLGFRRNISEAQFNKRREINQKVLKLIGGESWVAKAKVGVFKERPIGPATMYAAGASSAQEAFNMWQNFKGEVEPGHQPYDDWSDPEALVYHNGEGDIRLQDVLPKKV